MKSSAGRYYSIRGMAGKEPVFSKEVRFERSSLDPFPERWRLLFLDRDKNDFCAPFGLSLQLPLLFANMHLGQFHGSPYFLNVSGKNLARTLKHSPTLLQSSCSISSWAGWPSILRSPFAVPSVHGSDTL
jgi:hypothetical protein